MKLKCDILLSTFAFKFNLRRYNQARLNEQLEAERNERELAEKQLLDMKEAYDKLLEELEWRRKFNSCEWQGLTLVHVRAQLEQLQDTFMS